MNYPDVDVAGCMRIAVRRNRETPAAARSDAVSTKLGVHR
jgi:hypothetical protein